MTEENLTIAISKLRNFIDPRNNIINDKVLPTKFNYAVSNENKLGGQNIFINDIEDAVKILRGLGIDKTKDELKSNLKENQKIFLHINPIR